MLEVRLRQIRKDYGCFPKRADDYRLKRYNGSSWIETSAKVYSAYKGGWITANGFVFDGGVKHNFYGSIVDDIVTRLESRGITMKSGISTWNDITSDSEMLNRILLNDTSVGALLDDDVLRNAAKTDSRVLGAIKDYGRYGKAALSHIKNNAALRSEFIAISNAYSDKNDFKYLLSCEPCKSSGTVYVGCSRCGGYGYIQGSGRYFTCDRCGYFGSDPEKWDYCMCLNSISNGNYTSYTQCPVCNADERRDFSYVASIPSTCTDCGGKGCHF